MVCSHTIPHALDLISSWKLSRARPGKYLCGRGSLWAVLGLFSRKICRTVERRKGVSPDPSPGWTCQSELLRHPILSYLSVPGMVFHLHPSLHLFPPLRKACPCSWCLHFHKKQVALMAEPQMTRVLKVHKKQGFHIVALYLSARLWKRVPESLAVATSAELNLTPFSQY